ncbi:hypothetical protein BaRGS_00006664, partial [Batillaria attramentaria]
VIWEPEFLVEDRFPGANRVASSLVSRRVDVNDNKDAGAKGHTYTTTASLGEPEKSVGVKAASGGRGGASVSRRPLQDAVDLGSQLVMRTRCSVFMLTGAAMACGAVTLVTLALAVGTDYWLFMSEPYRMTAKELAFWNLTEPLDTDVVIYLRSGLWRVCTTNHNDWLMSPNADGMQDKTTCRICKR